MVPVLELVHLTKRYGGRPVLEDLTFELPGGQILGYFGLNGAGKSTTNRIVLGFSRPTSGQCRLFGEPGPDPRLLAKLGYLPENPYYYEYLTGFELVDYAARLCGVKPSERRSRVAAALERVRLEAHTAARPIAQYSKGMRQRLGLAQALVHAPPFLLLDEPFSGLDPLGRAMLKELLRAYRDGGGTVFFSSHQLLDAQEICDRVMILHQGRITVDSPLGELTARHPGKTLEQIFLALVGPDAASDRL